MNRAFTLVIVTSNRQAVGALALRDAALALGSSARIVVIGEDDIVAAVNGADNVIFRINPRTFYLYKEIKKQLIPEFSQKLGGLLDAFDKVKTQELLDGSGIPTPMGYAISKDQKNMAYPVVVKVLHGNQGIGVALLKNESDFKNFQSDFSQENTYLAQEFIAEARSKDKRLIVAGNTFVAAMQRQSTADDFRANLHMGGVAESYQPTALEIELAINAAHVFGLDHAGVDILDSARGPLVLEVNPSPGLAISKVTGINVAEAIMKELLHD